MLARPEPGTREHILLWLASQPPEKAYDWRDACVCACGAYAREAMGKSNLWWMVQAMKPGRSPFATLNAVAAICDTYGELYERMRSVWRKNDELPAQPDTRRAVSRRPSRVCIEEV